MGYRGYWVRWGAERLGVELTPRQHSRAIDSWEEAYDEVVNLVIDQYTDDLDFLVESLGVGEVALMATAIAVEQDDVTDLAVELILKRIDRRLKLGPVPRVSLPASYSDADPGL